MARHGQHQVLPQLSGGPYLIKVLTLIGVLVLGSSDHLGHTIRGL